MENLSINSYQQISSNEDNAAKGELQTQEEPSKSLIRPDQSETMIERQLSKKEKRKSSIHIGIEEKKENERKEDWIESENPIAFLNMHIFEQIDAKGKFRTKEMAAVDNRLNISKLRDLYVTVVISDILNVDPVGESFTIKYRTFLFFEADIQECGMEEFANKALESGHYYQLSRSEVEKFFQICFIPKIILFNQFSHTETDVMDIRIYGGQRGQTGVLMNQSYITVCRERFILHNFPFDLQYLTLEFRLNDSRTWNTFNLTISVVSFHKDCLKQLEWSLFVPQVKRGIPKTANTNICIPIQRKSGYYLSNIILILIILSALGLTTFAFHSDDLTGRTFIVLTLILTTVAFKFTAVAGSLPKVPYSTLMDQFMAFSIWTLALMTVFTIIPNFYIDDNHTDELINFSLAIGSIGLIVLGYGTMLAVSWNLTRKHRLLHDAIPLDKERPWYSFRYNNPKILVDLDLSIPFHESLLSNKSPVILPPPGSSTKTANGISMKSKTN